MTTHIVHNLPVIVDGKKIGHFTGTIVVIGDMCHTREINGYATFISASLAHNITLQSLITDLTPSDQIYCLTL